MRKLGIAVALTLGLAALGLAALYLFVEPDDFRETLEARAATALGREVRIGRVGLSLWPFGLRLRSLAVAALPGEEGGELLTVESVAVGARLLPLLSNRLEVTSLTIGAPRLTVVRAADGSWNLERLLAGPQPGADREGDGARGQGQVVVRRLRVTDGRVIVRDAGAGGSEPRVVTFQDLELVVHELSQGRPIDFELATRVAEYDVGLEARGRAGPIEGAAGQGGAFLELSELVAERNGSRLALRGRVEQNGGTSTVDLEVPSTNLPAADLAEWIALAGTASPVTLASPEPIRFEASIRGPIGGGRWPELRARAELRELTLEHPALEVPVEHIGANIVLEEDRLAISELGAVVGTTDVAGRITVDRFSPPRATFDLRSRRTDLDELLSFLVEEEHAEASATIDGDPRHDIELTGKLAADAGRFATLEFTALDAAIAYRNGTLALDPLSVGLYDGRFRGAITTRLAEDPPPFTLDGETEAIDVGRFLTDNLKLPAYLTGRLQGRISARGAGTELEQLLPRLEGSGTMEVTEGRVGELNVLAALSRVSGLFGEKTLGRLAGELAAEGTAFHRLGGELGFSGGMLRLDELSCETDPFRLGGDVTVNLLAGELDGSFRLAFSTEVSTALRAEDSLAAKVFWNSRTERVELPFTLSGPLASPRPGVDFDSVARERIGDDLHDRLAGELDRRLGRQTRTGDGAAAGGAAVPSPPAPVSARTHEDLSIEFSGSRWRGPILARDLEVSGSVSGRAIARASLAVADGGGRVLATLDLADVASAASATPDRTTRTTVAWKGKIEGELLLGGRAPYAVTVTVHNDAGEFAAATLPVER